MEASIDFYRALRELINQIPEGMVSTHLGLAHGLGDKCAVKAISEALQRDEFNEVSRKVVGKQVLGNTVFRDFKFKGLLKQLAELQVSMAPRVIQKDTLKKYELIAGADASYKNDVAYAACVVLNSELKVVETVSTKSRVRFPYIPGYLSFREASIIEAAIKSTTGFDVLLVNGHGIAHPRGCGLASHIGLNLEVPTIGVARRRLIGTEAEIHGGWSSLVHKGRIVGARLNGGPSRSYVSVGHNISLQTSMDIALKTNLSEELPKPLMIAHRAAQEFMSRIN